jgi:hypothetical protein
MAAMTGRIWLIGGVVLGVAIAAGEVPFVAGAAHSLSDTAQHIVGTGGHKLITSAAHHGVSRRIVNAATALLGVLVPGATALLLVVGAVGTLRLRAIVALALAVLGAASYAYQAGGVATGALVVALVVGAIALVATGPLVVAPLAALAGLIAGGFLPRLFERTATLPDAPVATLHQAIFNSAGSPLGLRVVVVIVGAIPFAVGARLVLSR